MHQIPPSAFGLVARCPQYLTPARSAAWQKLTVQPRQASLKESLAVGIGEVSHWSDALYFAYERALPASHIEGGLKQLVSHVRGRVRYYHHMFEQEGDIPSWLGSSFFGTHLVCWHSLVREGLPTVNSQMRQSYAKLLSKSSTIPKQSMRLADLHQSLDSFVHMFI